MGRRLYALHRWISALAMVQLGLWTASGLFFAIVPIETVRGQGVDRVHERTIDAAPGALTPSTVLACLGPSGLVPTHLELRSTAAGLFYVARNGEVAVRLDARTCAHAPVGRDEAEATARRDQAGAPKVTEAALLEVAPVEYRHKPLPAWRVVLGDADRTAVYIDARTGDVTARRNDTWRTYDFLWSLHIMDYSERESFNHPLIIAAASLAAATVVSGTALWVLRLVRRVLARGQRARASIP